MKVKDYNRLIDVAEPRLRKVESVLKPRYTFLFSDAADRLMGAFFVLAAISVILPLPGSNFPPADRLGPDVAGDAGRGRSRADGRPRSSAFSA